MRGVAGKVSAASGLRLRWRAVWGISPISLRAFAHQAQQYGRHHRARSGQPFVCAYRQGLEQELRKHDMLALITQPPEARGGSLSGAGAGHAPGQRAADSGQYGDAMLEEAVQQKIPTVPVNRGSGERRSPAVNDDQESTRTAIAHLRALGQDGLRMWQAPASSSSRQRRKKAFLLDAG